MDNKFLQDSILFIKANYSSLKHFHSSKNGGC